MSGSYLEKFRKRLHHKVNKPNCIHVRRNTKYCTTKGLDKLQTMKKEECQTVTHQSIYEWQVSTSFKLNLENIIVELLVLAMKGEILEHFDVFRSTMSEQHGYNTRNGYMAKISKPRTEWDRNKTYYKAITEWASLPSELKRLMPKRILYFRHLKYILDSSKWLEASS